jgi:hypothetical protein
MLNLIVLLVLGCADPVSPPPLPKYDPATDTAVLPDTGDPVLPDPEFCDDAPVVSWSNFGRGFLLEACQGCHASTASERFGAPDDVVFDTESISWAQADRILARATGEYSSMPPLGGTSEIDKLRLEYWLRCGLDPD